MKFKENETTEFKRSTSELKEAIVSVGAILNRHGKGTVYFGIEDSGRVIGQQIGRSTIKDISKSISDHIDPKIFPDIQARKISGKDCIVVEFSGHEGLYSAYGRFYIRAGEEDKKLSVGEVERLAQKKKNYVYSWGVEVSEMPVSEANVSSIRSFIKKGKEAGRISFSFDSAKNVLNKLDLVRGGKLLNAGRALFCKENEIEVQAAVFAGEEKITFLDIQSFRGNLFELIEKSEAYIKEHINWRADLSGSKRIEIPEVPIRAIKEAIINSLCHRDFTNPKSNEIAIYRNRIEIYNPGQFPHDYSPEDFIKGNEPSIPRNPLIAETLYRSRDIEKWGSGLRRITEECRSANIKVDFRKTKSGFVVTFHRLAMADFQRVARKGGQKRWPEKVARKGGQKITPKQRVVLNILQQDPFISRDKLADKLKINVSAVRKHLDALRRNNFIRRVGPDKGGYWQEVKG
jgi:ATP-dependent DNA helicase RecG